MRLVFACLAAGAPLLLLLNGDSSSANFWLVAGAVVCLAAFAFGYELAFVTYAIASWIIAAGFVVSHQRLDSPLGVQFADAAYLMTAAAVVTGLVRSAFARRRP